MKMFDSILEGVKSIFNGGGKRYTRIFLRPLMMDFLEGKKFDLCIEIGAFEGYTSNILVEHLNENGRLICIDPLKDQFYVDNLTEEYIEGNKTKWGYFKGQYKRFKHNVKEHLKSGKIVLIRKLSKDAFKDLKGYKGKVDFCYVDGDHRAQGVYNDGKSCFELIRVGGFIFFDDYERKEFGRQVTKEGVDRFLKEYKGKYKIISKERQIIIQKIKNI